jgi:hypothetical protein
MLLNAHSYYVIRSEKDNEIQISYGDENMLVKLAEVVDQSNLDDCLIEVECVKDNLIRISTEQGLDLWTFEEIEALHKYVQVQMQKQNN